MLYYVEDADEFDELKQKDKKGILFISKISETKVLLESDSINGEADISIIKRLVVDLLKYYESIIFNWHPTIPSFNIKNYPADGEVPKSIVRFDGKIVGINPFIQDLVGDIVDAISKNLKHKEGESRIISIDFIKNSIDNKE